MSTLKRNKMSFEEFAELESYYFVLLRYTYSKEFFYMDGFKRKEMYKELYFIEITVKALKCIYQEELQSFRPIKLWSSDKKKFPFIFYFSNFIALSIFLKTPQSQIRDNAESRGAKDGLSYKFADKNKVPKNITVATVVNFL